MSEAKESRLLHFAGDDGGKAAGGQQDGADEPAADTPAGKKWAALRLQVKEAEKKAEIEREGRLVAEAKAAAIEDLKQHLGYDPTKKKPESGANGGNDDEGADDLKINPEDEKLLNTYFTRQLKKLGLDKIPEVVTTLQQTTNSNQAQNALERAKADLEGEFAGSVPYDHEATLKYAREHGFGLTFDNAKTALRMAHKEMKENEFIEFYKGGAKPKKIVPKMAASGRAADDEVIDTLDDKKIDTESISSLEDARKLGKQMFDEE